VAVAVTINGARRVTTGLEQVLMIDVTVGTSHQLIPFKEDQLLKVGTAAQMITYISTQALQSVTTAPTTTTLPAGFPEIRATTMVTGSMPVAGLGVTQRTATADTTVTTSDYAVWCDTTSNSIIVTLPSAIGIGGQRFEFKKIAAANTATLTPAGSEKIDGASTQVLTVNGAASILTSDNANWVHMPGVAAQTNMTAANLAAVADAPAKACLTALSAGLVAEGIFVAPA